MQLQLKFSTSKQLFSNRSFFHQFSSTSKWQKLVLKNNYLIIFHFSILGFQTMCLEKVIMISHLKQSDNGILLFCRGISLKLFQTFH